MPVNNQPKYALARWLLVIIVLALAACAPAQDASCPKLKIGVSVVTEDTSAKLDQDQGYQAALNEINLQGVGGCKLELTNPAEPKSTVGDVPRDVRGFADAGVVAILSEPSNDAAKRAAKMAGYFSIPVIISADTGDDIGVASEPQWFFRINPSQADYSLAAVKWIQSVKNTPGTSVAIWFEHSEYGESAAVSAADTVMKSSLALGIYQRYSPFLADFKEYTDQLLAVKPNVVWIISSQPSQARKILLSIRSLSNPSAGATAYSPALMVGMGVGFTGRDFLYNPEGDPVLTPETLGIPIPWATDLSWKGSPQCELVSPPVSPLNLNTPLSVRNVQSYLSLKLVAGALERLSKKTDWVMGEVKVSDWKEMVRNPAYLPEFRRALSQEILATKGCQFGGILWAVNFSSTGLNQGFPQMMKMDAGKWVTVAPGN